jgi:hypothetical protein
MSCARAITRCIVLCAGLWLSACGDSITYDGTLAGSTDAGLLPADFTSRPYHRRCAPDAGAAGSDAVDLDAYDRLLARHVRPGDGGFARVDYLAWSDSEEDLASLDAHLEQVATARPGECDLSFWINAYNAIVLREVLDVFEARLPDDPDFSVADDDFAFFTRQRHAVASESLSLDELEHGVIRGDWRHPSVQGAPALDRMMALHAGLWQGASVDARIHMALNCAARGCPNLRAWAYRRGMLDRQLADSTQRFLDNAQKGAGPRGVSRLFDWFRQDFERDAGSVAAFITAYRSEGLLGVELGRFVEYDWTLNGP